jgi:hypothetical protein
VTLETAVISPTEETQGSFDARVFWSRLPAELQTKVGETAVLLALAMRAPLDDSRWLHAKDEAVLRLTGLAGRMWNLAPFPDEPDLAAFGIRACRSCGCTDMSGCEHGCIWVAADLCSACARPAPARHW